MSPLRRNLVPILVGVQAVLVSIAAIVVIADRVGDDGGRYRGRSGDTRFSRDFERFEAEPRGLLLGITAEVRDGALVVQQVLPGSPAERAGVRPGDRIERAAGRDVDTIEDLLAAVAPVPFGREYDLVVRRDGREQTLRAVREPVTAFNGGGRRGPGMQPPRMQPYRPTDPKAPMPRMQPGAPMQPYAPMPRMQPGFGGPQPGPGGMMPGQPLPMQPGGMMPSPPAAPSPPPAS